MGLQHGAEQHLVVVGAPVGRWGSAAERSARSSERHPAVPQDRPRVLDVLEQRPVHADDLAEGARDEREPAIVKRASAERGERQRVLEQLAPEQSRSAGDRARVQELAEIVVAGRPAGHSVGATRSPRSVTTVASLWARIAPGESASISVASLSGAQRSS